MDAGEFYALLRFEEAALALRVSFALDIVDRIGSRALSCEDVQEEFQFTPQAVRTFFALLRVMNLVKLDSDGRIATTPIANECLSTNSSFSRRPYLAMGGGSEVDEFIKVLRGDFSTSPPALYGREDEAPTLMDVDEVASEISYGLASRAKCFSKPLATAICQQAATDHRTFADLGAGSPYVADACRKALPQLQKFLLVDRANGMQYIRNICEDEKIDLSKIEFCEQDFFAKVPSADIYNVSNTAHDWLQSEYIEIMSNVRRVISPNGIVCIHEPLLRTTWNDRSEWLDALWMACYAVTLFRLTLGKGSCYSVEEHDAIQERVGFARTSSPVRTVDGCTALFYKPHD